MITDPDKVWEVLITNDDKQYAKYDWFYRSTQYTEEKFYEPIKINWCFYRSYKKYHEVCITLTKRKASNWFIFNDDFGKYNLVMQEREKYSMINTVLLDTLASVYKTSSGYFDCESWSGKYDEFCKLDCLKMYGLNDTQFKYLFHPDSYPNPNKISHFEFAQRIHEMLKEAEKDNG